MYLKSLFNLVGRLRFERRTNRLKADRFENMAMQPTDY
jgi:hypothetical protein